MRQTHFFAYFTHNLVYRQVGDQSCVYSTETFNCFPGIQTQDADELLSHKGDNLNS